MNINAKLIAWNATFGALTYSFKGVTQTSIVVPITRLHRASLNRFVPTDPVLPIVKRWNALIDSTKEPVIFGPTNPPTDIENTFSGITGELAAAGAFMTIHLKHNSTIVYSLRPIPFIPPNPV